MKFGKIEWLVSALSSGYVFYTLYNKAVMIYVNVPYFSEIASADDVSMRNWMYVNSAELVIFGIAAFILALFLLGSVKEVWLTKGEKKEKVEKIKGKKKGETEVVPEKRVVRFD